MKKIFLAALCITFFMSCKQEKQQAAELVVWEPFDEGSELTEQANHENPRMRYKLINSKISDKNDIWRAYDSDLADFSEEKYEALKPLIIEQDIPAIQAAIRDKKLSHEELVLFYIYRIRKYESDNQLSLNAVISLNPDVVEEARKLDKEPFTDGREYSIYGMPVLVKDNIGTSNMYTTAGAAILAENKAKDAFIVDRLQENGALILGKANLSEWAYYFCSGCPVGYSAIGGQTLNPYGRKVFESGGSSSGSGVATAANYAIATVGTETSGSILSPSSQNSVVGLKPTIGLLSRTGIVPISSTLDTPGPMTKNVIDNAIFLNAMTGKDNADAASVASDKDYLKDLKSASLKGKRLGVIKQLLQDTIYAETVDKLRGFGAEIIEFDPPQVAMNGFLTLLNIDMKYDLPAYLKDHASENIDVAYVKDVVEYNLKDTLVRAPYGQQLFDGIVADSTTREDFEAIKNTLNTNGKHFFDVPMEEHQLDAVLSINNYHAGFAAVAKYPCLTVPMGYKPTGEPISLTFIGKPFTEDALLKLGYAYEKETGARKAPENYQ
ncbi:amidase [Leptobacterium flavescens]|uniref:Amidase n=1 Tax=Leptobacterium flavescens TaxID=472055 RepID=A0A6P0UIH3_9FLAO|nr:amidase family protein [Leptobacterium flavescens]NER12250.1 amidase [Leptobacterium flavescens]